MTKTGTQAASSEGSKAGVGGIPAGLSENAYKKLLGDNSFSPEEIEKVFQSNLF